MLILEKPFSNETFVKLSYCIDDGIEYIIEKIKNTPSNSTVVFKYNDKLIDVFVFCRDNDIPYGVIVENVKELIFISNLNAKYAFIPKSFYRLKSQLIKISTKIAETYLLDTKIILLVDSLDEIEEIIKKIYVIEYPIDGIKLDKF